MLPTEQVLWAMRYNFHIFSSCQDGTTWLFDQSVHAVLPTQQVLLILPGKLGCPQQTFWLELFPQSEREIWLLKLFARDFSPLPGKPSSFATSFPYFVLVSFRGYRWDLEKEQNVDRMHLGRMTLPNLCLYYWPRAIRQNIRPFSHCPD